MILILFLSSMFYAQEVSKPVSIKGFYLGMAKPDVESIFEDMKKKNVAERISIERENYRDLITLDNEFGSMGNKIEINYDDNGLAKSFLFQYTTVDILFTAADKTVEEFVDEFRKEYSILEMEFEDSGFVKLWKYISIGYQITIDNNKNLRLMRVQN